MTLNANKKRGGVSGRTCIRDCRGKKTKKTPRRGGAVLLILTSPCKKGRTHDISGENNREGTGEKRRSEDLNCRVSWAERLGGGPAGVFDRRAVNPPRKKEGLGARYQGSTTSVLYERLGKTFTSCSPRWPKRGKRSPGSSGAKPSGGSREKRALNSKEKKGERLSQGKKKSGHLTIRKKERRFLVPFVRRRWRAKEKRIVWRGEVRRKKKKDVRGENTSIPDEFLDAQKCPSTPKRPVSKRKTMAE